MKPTMIPTNIDIIPRQKIITADALYSLDDKVNDFIQSIYKKGFRVISIAPNVKRQEDELFDKYSTVIIYG